LQAPLAKKTAEFFSAHVNDRDVLEVETGLDDKEMVPWEEKKEEEETEARKFILMIYVLLPQARIIH